MKSVRLNLSEFFLRFAPSLHLAQQKAQRGPDDLRLAQSGQIFQPTENLLVGFSQSDRGLQLLMLDEKISPLGTWYSDSYGARMATALFLNHLGVNLRAFSSPHEENHAKVQPKSAESRIPRSPNLLRSNRDAELRPQTHKSWPGGRRSPHRKVSSLHEVCSRPPSPKETSAIYARGEQP